MPKLGYIIFFLEEVLLLWRRGCFLEGYFCYGGGGVFEVEGCKVCVLEGVLLLWRRGCFLEGVLLLWKKGCF